MRRGFKAEAERIAEQVREEMGLSAVAPADSWQVAQHMGVMVRSADQLIGRQKLESLAEIQADAFSAATFRLPGGRIVVVTNPMSTHGRVNSDLAHELAHLLLNHRTRRIETIAGRHFLTCDRDQEEEANWLGGCLLLPREVLLVAARNGWTPERVAEEHGVSIPMARFRLNASGVLIQVGRGRRRRRPAVC